MLYETRKKTAAAFPNAAAVRVLMLQTFVRLPSEAPPVSITALRAMP